MRAQLYAQLYNKIEAIKTRKADISVLDIELLFDVCESLKPEKDNNKNHPVKDKESLFHNFLKWKTVWFTPKDRCLVQGKQSLLCQKNVPGLYQLSVCGYRRLISYPPYVFENDERGPREPVHVYVPKNACNGYWDHVVGIRALYKYQAIDDNDVYEYHVRFCDAVSGFDYCCKLPQARDSSFDHCASEWVTTDIGKDTEKNFCFLGYKVGDEYYCTKVDLPQSSNRRYRITIPYNFTSSNTTLLRLNMPIIKGTVEEESVYSCDKNSIAAVAYDISNDYMLCASGNMLMRLFKSRFRELQSKGHFEIVGEVDEDIKKIYVLDGNVYLVVTQGNKIYTIFYGKKGRVEQMKLGEHLLIDALYDRESQKLVLLTKEGVFQCSCFVSKLHSNSAYVPSETESRRPENEWEAVALAINKKRGFVSVNVDSWNVERDDMKLVENESFNYAKHEYKEIAMCSKQIIVTGALKVSHLYGYPLLVYPPLQ